jgi:cell division protein FtsB
MEKLGREKKFFIFAIFAFLYILILTFLFERRGLLDVLNSRKELLNLKREVEILKKDKERLEWEVRILKDNPKSIEDTARRELGFIYPDEIVVILDEKTMQK